MPDSYSPAANDAPTSTLTERDMERLEQCLDAIPAPLEPLDLMMLDGYLCGVLLQPAPVPESLWFPHVVDVDGRPAPAAHNLTPLQTLVRRRHAELNRAIHGRQWFDPWVFELDDEDDPLQAVMPWVAGFATAMEFFPQLMKLDGKQVLEPLAVLYRAFDPEDLEDADELLEMIEMLEPPNSLEDAVEGLVSSTLLLADASRPQSGTPTSKPSGSDARGGRRHAASRAGGPPATVERSAPDSAARKSGSPASKGGGKQRR
jgi:uncharacterized protein